MIDSLMLSLEIDYSLAQITRSVVDPDQVPVHISMFYNMPSSADESTALLEIKGNS